MKNMGRIMLRYFSVFKDESKLDINYVPPRLPHREQQLNLLNQFFRFAIESPGKMTQRVLISGRIGTGKTVLSQRFGLNMTKEAQGRGINLHYVHVNCRECKGSLFMILQRPILELYPHFPKRGYRAEELLQMLMQILDERNAYLILAMDELEALIRSEGSDPLYNLTRVQEDRIKAPQRLSLICVLRETEYLGMLDPSTRSTLQRNIIHLDEYSKTQLQDILNDRVSLAFKDGAVPPQIVDIVAELAVSEGGDARYAIELLWRAGKYADASESPEVLPECVRKAAISVYPIVRKDTISSLGLHEKLFLLGVSRRFKQTRAAYMLMGEAEDAYAVVCEEYGEKRRGHTQLWKYVKELSALGVLKAEPSGVGRRGKTTLISLPRVPASDLEQELSRVLYMRRG
ncbi:MAG: ORC1-type DNA replication protein 2 [Candidatus Bathyarchaeota archaeon BA1]|nr:MAG: ORC1-type DNA replication protein 2 [Candidatus Bathyarchaeota archaeon BA1]